MRKKILIIITTVLLLVSCNPTDEVKGSWEQIFINQDIVASDGFTYLDPFNTVMYIRYFIEENHEAEIDSIQNVYTEEVVRLHKLFDRHYTYYVDDSKPELGLINNVNKINSIYGKDESLIIDKDLFKILKLGIEYTKVSGGKFNILVGTLSSFWENLFSNYENFFTVEEIDPKYNTINNEKMVNIANCIPTYEQIEDILVLNEEDTSVQFNSIEKLDNQGNNICADIQYKPSITLGGIGKGYATKAILEKLVSLGYTNGALLSGGSSISSLGPSFLKNGQAVTIGDPRSNFFENKIAFTIRLKSKFDLSTSGNYTTGKSYRFIDYDKEEIIYRHHILNPISGLPSNYHRSVTVYSETVDAAILDAISTILVNLSLEEGIAFQKSMNNQGIKFEVVWINQIGLENQVSCEANQWCPPYPSSLIVTSTSNFSNTLTVEEGVTLNYVS